MRGLEVAPENPDLEVLEKPNRGHPAPGVTRRENEKRGEVIRGERGVDGVYSRFRFFKVHARVY
jgi:hypothetical protein